MTMVGEEKRERRDATPEERSDALSSLTLRDEDYASPRAGAWARRTAALAVAVAAAVGAVLWGVNGGVPEGGRTAPAPESDGGAVDEVGARVVRVAIARSVGASSPPEQVLMGAGYLAPGSSVISIGTRIPSRVDRFLVQEGDRVEEGQALVHLDDTQYVAALDRTEAQLNSARAQLELAQAELARARELSARAILSQGELDLRRSRMKVADATLREIEAEWKRAKANVEFTVVRAPIAGVVLSKEKEAGEVVVPGGFAGSGDLLSLADLADLRAEVDVSESDLSLVEIGQAAEVLPDAYRDRVYPARVSRLFPQVDRQKGTLQVELELLETDELLLPDMSVRVRFLSGPSGVDDAVVADGIEIPLRALRQGPEGSYVWVSRNDRAEREAVEVARLGGDDAIVTGGLRGGDSVVVDDPPDYEGQRLEPRR